MRKWLSLFLIGLLAISVVASGCISSGGGETSTQTKGKIAIVYDVGGRGDLSFNDMAYLGAKKASEDFNLELVELQSNTEDDYVKNLETLAQQGD
ncbi:BMP family ABC transporter substrate-binding protein, partial [Thermococcus sp.]